MAYRAWLCGSGCFVPLDSSFIYCSVHLCRQCSSGLQAIADVAAAIKAGFYTIGIGAGVEQMTADGMSWKGSVNPKVMENQEAQDCLLPMGMHIALI